MVLPCTLGIKSITKLYKSINANCIIFDKKSFAVFLFAFFVCVCWVGGGGGGLLSLRRKKKYCSDRRNYEEHRVYGNFACNDLPA
jgi:hypothetical protein